MSNLENLIAKILKDAEDEAARILADASAKVARIMEEKKNAAEKEKEHILNDAATEAEKAAERIELGKRLEIRDAKLNAKRAVIDKVFALVLQKLNSMPKAKYWAFLCNHLAETDLDGEELILPAKYAVTNIDELNAFLKEKGKKGDLTLYDGPREINGGFILLKNGVENNNTFEMLLQYYRYDLENDIIKNLF